MRQDLDAVLKPYLAESSTVRSLVVRRLACEAGLIGRRTRVSCFLQPAVSMSTHALATLTLAGALALTAASMSAQKPAEKPNAPEKEAHEVEDRDAGRTRRRAVPRRGVASAAADRPRESWPRSEQPRVDRVHLRDHSAWRHRAEVRLPVGGRRSPARQVRPQSRGAVRGRIRETAARARLRRRQRAAGREGPLLRLPGRAVCHHEDARFCRCGKAVQQGDESQRVQGLRVGRGRTQALMAARSKPRSSRAGHSSSSI